MQLLVLYLHLWHSLHELKSLSFVIDPAIFVSVRLLREMVNSCWVSLRVNIHWIEWLPFWSVVSKLHKNFCFNIKILTYFSHILLSIHSLFLPKVKNKHKILKKSYFPKNFCFWPILLYFKQLMSSESAVLPVILMMNVLFVVVNHLDLPSLQQGLKTLLFLL